MEVDTDLEALLEEITQKYFEKQRAFAEFFGLIDGLPDDVRKRVLRAFETASGPKFLSEIAEEIGWAMGSEENPCSLESF